MSVSVETIESVIRSTTAVYAAAEQALLERAAAAIRADSREGIGRYDLRRWSRMNEFRATAQQVFGRTNRSGAGAAAAALSESAQRGRDGAVRDLDFRGVRASAPIGPATIRGTLVRGPASLMSSLASVHPMMLASTEGLYRQVMQEVLTADIRSERDRIAASQRLLNQFAARGVTGFVDRGGKRWNVVHYVEMATRTACAQVAIDAHLDQVQRAGLDVVVVSVVANCSPLCAPFQGRLLSLSGGTSGVVDGGRRIPVVTSVAEAKARGLHHPGCRHKLTVWVPGDPRPGKPPKVDPADYVATQRLRTLERKVRASKRRHAVALTPAAATAANAHTRALQKQIRELTAASNAPRIRRREQLDLGYKAPQETPQIVSLAT